MSEAFVRVVLDDALPADRLGALTLTEVRDAQIEALKEPLAVALVALLGDVKVTPAQLQGIVAKAVDVAMTTVQANVERLELRLRGREPTH